METDGIFSSWMLSLIVVSKSNIESMYLSVDMVRVLEKIARAASETCTAGKYVIEDYFDADGEDFELTNKEVNLIEETATILRNVLAEEGITHPAPTGHPSEEGINSAGADGWKLEL